MGNSSSKDYEKLDAAEPSTLNIAVVGEAGAGKSCLVNMLRDLSNEENAAATRSIEMTMARAWYPHPSIPDVFFWDLPGTGRRNFHAKNYVKEMHFKSYDIFIIVSCCRFSENDVDLIKEINKLNKPFYFVRSKIDNDIYAEEQKYGNVDPQKVMNKIRRDCTCKLLSLGEEFLEIFLISGFHQDMYDFPKLISTLARDEKILEFISKQKSKEKNENTEKLDEAYRQGNSEAVAATAAKLMKAEEAVMLHVAVTGSTGTGKSSLINALRGLNDTEEGAAKTEVMECTMEPTPYLHPDLPRVIYWDLPGIGGAKITAKQYLQNMKFERYDFFIVVISSCVKENDMNIVAELRRLRKPFYFIRSKIDEDIRAAQKKNNSVNVEDVLVKIKDSCVNELNKVGKLQEQSVKVFLVSRFDLENYDFAQFKTELSKELPKQKNDIFQLSLPSFSHETIEEKKKILKRSIWLVAAASGGIAAVPIPGLSFACDTAMIASSVLSYRLYLGLDNKSLSTLARRVQKPVKKLKSQIQHPLLQGEVTPDVITKLLLSTTYVGLMSVEELFHFIPVFGSLVSAPLSCMLTFRILNDILNAFTENAHKVLDEALKK
ncbi:T-cell-specific guanine nucleotide triphosphate-binding protein 2-like [Protopterus annectens]|uniref:T-cell-specific guanine nucleotide triphosphate-binding protein 2-like n=1 Tax=Protopterus annectens TaxID=7888 RepID=UPI001CFB2CF8|nr:T-cell-specific guanine nucleotide triphosphate-binding protein 2-like [Protopterus annectens]XP_043943336.1 T-cell-specific guanine nucleotide triphosphate-binding protein 2-like [Protopterus annectens]